MKFINSKFIYIFLYLITANILLLACSEFTIPGDLPGTYTGKQRILIRYNKGGQYIYWDDFVMINMNIDSSGQVSGTVGEAAFAGCNVTQNRGWIAHQLGIKTDFIIKGILKGHTIDKDTVDNKNISIPFNIANDELKGSLFVTTNGDGFSMINTLKLQKK